MLKIDTGKKLTIRQLRTISAVLQSGTIEAACSKAGISRTLFYRWLRKSPAFRAELDAALNQVTSSAINELKTILQDAVQVLHDSLTDTDSKVRLMAAGKVLDYFIKVRETQEFDERLTQLETQTQVIKMGNREIHF